MAGKARHLDTGVRDQPYHLQTYCRSIALKQMFQAKFLFLDGPDLYTGGKYSTCIFLVRSLHSMACACCGDVYTDSVVLLERSIACRSITDVLILLYRAITGRGVTSSLTS